LSGLERSRTMYKLRANETRTLRPAAEDQLVLLVDVAVYADPPQSEVLTRKQERLRELISGYVDLLILPPIVRMRRTVGTEHEDRKLVVVAEFDSGERVVVTYRCILEGAFASGDRFVRKLSEVLLPLQHLSAALGYVPWPEQDGGRNLWYKAGVFPSVDEASLELPGPAPRIVQAQPGTEVL
jgi:hypothetical protein